MYIYIFLCLTFDLSGQYGSPANWCLVDNFMLVECFLNSVQYMDIFYISLICKFFFTIYAYLVVVDFKSTSTTNLMKLCNYMLNIFFLYMINFLLHLVLYILFIFHIHVHGGWFLVLNIHITKCLHGQLMFFTS